MNTIEWKPKQLIDELTVKLKELVLSYSLMLFKIDADSTYI